MKPSLPLLLVTTTFLGLFFLPISEPKSDSCNINLNLKVPIPFDITNLHCLSVWDSQSFILRYVQTSRNTWSFILSTPYTNSYIAMGFSTNGGMVGSSAIVGWVVSGGKGGGIKQYYLGGYAPNQVVPNKGNLNVVANSTFITLESNHLYMVFQLQTTTQPLSWIIFATGSIGLFPQAPSFALTKHLDKISQRIDYSKAKFGSSQGDSTSNSSSSSSSSQANGNNGSNGSLSSQGDSCGSNLNLNAPLFFDTTKLICIPVWNTQGFILRYYESSPNTWSFILSAPNPNSYIAIGFSPNGGMVGASAIVGWISTNNGAGGGMKQYYLAGTTPNMVVPDRGNLVILTNSTLITSQSSTLYMVFQLQTNQPLSRVIFAIGPSGTFPSSPSFALSMHQDKFSMTLDYSTEWDPFWFYFHASVQSLGFIIGTIGVISGLVLNNQLQVDVSLHKALGIIILVLACLQMMALLARPNKASKMRKYWNLYHHNTGRVLIILAIANIFYGIHLGREGNAWKVGYGIVLAILLFIGFLFEINMWSSLEEDDD
ncbi:cytochrome b561 and DOMON domain-containing protein At3g07570 [Arachis duranensis]|uniref:Cytochrome b561 and DOMON domain-containing protein At3g07570 n=1 Tax=Arachis duranensis TaxID=130453 RepID=A0A9C6TAW8_ARADU|nr:cytochrome b561 and DOMON domain-containing protein At3g07570 [Arachis duranensis]